MIKRLAKPIVVLFIVALLFAATAQAQDEEIPRGGTVVVSSGGATLWQRNFNPFSPNPVAETNNMVYEPLLLYNAVLGGELTPWLATDYAWSEDLLTLTFTLRQDVKWNDGEEFNADDVVFTMDLLKEHPEFDRQAVWGFVDSVEKIDDYTVAFQMSRVFTQADYLLGSLNPVPEHIWSSIEDPVTFLNPEPVATGPFSVVKRFEDQVYELCRNETYWQTGKPYVDCLRYPAYPSGSVGQTTALNNGDIDWVGYFVADVDNTYVAADPEHNHYYFWPASGSVLLFMNTTKPPYDDVNFRRALSMAIDYGSMVEIGEYGYTVPASPTGLGLAHEKWISQEALDKAAETGQGVFDPEAAAALLDELGYVDANKDGWRDMPTGEPLEFEIQTVNGWPDWTVVVQIISQNFQDIGLNATMVTPDYGLWMSNLQQGDYEVSIGWGDSGPTPWNFYHDILYSSLIDAKGFANATTWGRWTSDETDKLIDDFVATTNPDEQIAISNQLQMLFVENMVAIPLFPGPQWYEWNDKRFTGFPTEEDYYAVGSPFDQARLIVATSIHLIKPAE